MKKLHQLKLKFLGVRGSRPLHEKDFLKTGGNSTCIQITGLDSAQIFIDCGTGLANHFNKIKETPNNKHPSNKYHILITHTHWDHIISIPYLSILFDPKASIVFYSATGSNGNFLELFERLFQFGHAGVQRDQVKATIRFKDVTPGVPFLIENKVRVESFQVNHPAVTLGYKLSYKDASFAVITDSAPFTNKNYLGDGMKELAKQLGDSHFQANYLLNLTRFVRGVDFLVYDTHFNDLNSKPDWGHSTPRVAIEICKLAQVKQLLMFHHAPEDNDSNIEKKLNDALGLAQGETVKINNAIEEDVWIVKSA
jgi:ribonuclease BN (tRNA processing enzyme)